MTVMMVPAIDGEEWPTLGPAICEFIETHLVFGPGDLRGEPYRLDDQKRAFVYRMYEVWPADALDGQGNPIGGRRRFRRCCLSLQKGDAKTEFAAILAACELHPEAPVRCYDFDSYGRPVGRGVTDPYIPMVAYTEEQTEDLAYAALKAIIELSPLARDFDIGLERIMRRGGDGKAVALASAPDARDGARTTFAHKDETHRWTLPRLKRAHRTMIANLPKRMAADPWELETTTAYSPGEGSVAQETAEYAAKVHDGEIRDSRLFYFHRQASDGYDLADRAQLRAAVIEAAGPTAAWKDIEGICDQWQDPSADLAYLERVYLNRPVAVADVAFDVVRWVALASDYRPDEGALITLGFDGSRFDDATALVATEVETGFMWPVAVWERPQTVEDWEVPLDVVDAVVDETFRTYDVWRMYADPSKWDAPLATWAGRYGDKKVLAWPTTLYRKMALAIKAFAGAIVSGEVAHGADPVLTRHIGNAVRHHLNFRDDDESPLWLIQKDRKGSPNKIDGAQAAVLSWQARLDAVASGARGSAGWWLQ